MSNSVFMLWLEDVDPQVLSAVPSLARLAANGVDVQLNPTPLAEKSICYYQTLTGLGAGKFGRFDSVRPEGYQAVEEVGIPDGAAGHTLPDILSARKLTVSFSETRQEATPDKLVELVEQRNDCTVVRLNLSRPDAAAVDALVQQCVELVGPQTHLMVLADLWSRGPLKHVNINDFLADAGLLEVGEPRSRAAVSWNETLAYGLGAGQVWINLRGREAKGCVDSGQEFHAVCEALVNELCTNWLDQQTHEQVVTRVLRKEEAYTGDYLFKAPDLTVVYGPGYAASPNAISLDFDGVSIGEASSAARPSSPYARLIAAGPCLASGISEKAALVDIVPTILYLLGQAIPTRVDGSPIATLFTQVYREQTRIEHSEADDASLSDEDEDLIVDRLRALGYLG